MKITLTKQEIRYIITQHFQLPEDTEVEISGEEDSLEYATLKKMIAQIEKMAYTSHQKIQAIKFFRENINCGLAEAKWAVENWAKFVAFVVRTKRIPKFDGNYSNGGYFLL